MRLRLRLLLKRLLLQRLLSNLLLNLGIRPEKRSDAFAPLSFFLVDEVLSSHFSRLLNA